MSMRTKLNIGRNNMKILAAGLVVLGLATGAANAASKGQVARVPGHAWVTVANPQPVRNANGTFNAGDSCSIKFGGTLTSLGDLDGKHQLVRYLSTDFAAGALCPTGVVFSVDNTVFDGMDAAYEEVAASKFNESARVRKLMGFKD